MRSRQLTDAQRQHAEARRVRFRALVNQVAGMSETERAELNASMAGAVTVEGHTLSLHNAMLLACQQPDATLVGGFQQWRAHGRTVRKGEHGLMIWAPVRSRQRAEPAATGEGPGPDELSTDHPRYIMVTVFDVSQTEARNGGDEYGRE